MSLGPRSMHTIYMVLDDFFRVVDLQVNHGWLRRDPSKHPYLPRLCERIILPGPGGEYLDDCTRGRSCPNAHSLEEIQYHHQVCPHGSKCRSRAFCPHAHILGSDNDIASAAAAAAAAAGAAAGGGSASKRPSSVIRRSSSSSCSASPRPCSVDAAAAGDGYGRGGSGGVGGGRVAEEGWQTVARRGRRAPSPAESEIRAWAPPARIRSRSWSASDLLSPSAEGGGGGHNHHRGSSREFRRRATGVTGLLAALRKRSADVMQPPAKHNELLRTIYSTLRRREPNGCDEKELVSRVFHASMSASAERRGRGGDVNAGTPAGVSVAGGGGEGTTGDAPESHRFSKTKVRGAVTLLKFAQAVRVGRGDTAGQHVLYVAYELPTFSDFMARHNSHLVDMAQGLAFTLSTRAHALGRDVSARELGVDMTAMDWKSLLETEQSSGGGGGRPIPSTSPTDQSEGTPQSPAGQNGHGCRSLSSSPTVQSSPRDNELQFAPRASSEHALWHGGQLLQLQPTHPRPTQQHQQYHHHQQVGIQQYIQQLPSPQQQLSQPPPPPPPPPSSAAVGGVWGQQAAGPQGLPLRGLQGVGPPQAGLVSPAAPSPTAMKQGQEQTLLSMPLSPPPPPAMVSAQVGGVGGYGMVLPLHGSPLNRFLGGGSQGPCSPLGYGLGGNGGNLTPSPQRQQQQQQQQQQQLHLPVLAPHAAVAAVQPHQVYGFGHVQQGTAVVCGGQVHHPSSHAGLSWAPGLVGQGPHGGGGSGGASRQMTMEEAAAAARAGAEGVTEPPPPLPSALGQRESGEQFPVGTSSSAQSLPGDVNGPTGGVGGGRASFSGAPSAGGMMQAPVPVALEARRQSSLPPLSGSSLQPAFTISGARMAHTPSAIASRRLGFPPSGGGEKGSDPRAASGATGSDAAAAATAVAAGGGAAEAWERERSRFGVRGNRPSPVESRIAAVAIAAQNAAAAASVAAAAAAATEENNNRASAAAVGPGAVPRDNFSPPEPAVATTDSTAPAAAVAAAAAAAPSFAGSAAKGTAELPVRHPYATDNGVDALDVELGELSLEEMGGGDDTTALPGLNEIASNSRR
ncbi:unnamed protein product [Ectocarpus sp. CCAP 1310/34]|nr:unnamed protein product [Ectocarpus sp. CCAP 1310/34]